MVMSLEDAITKLERFVRERPALADVPVAIVGGRPVTPRDMLEMLRRGEHVEEVLSALVRLGIDPSEDELKELAKEYYKGMRGALVVLTSEGCKVVTAEDAVREIEEGTEVGRVLMEMYLSMLRTMRMLLN